ncbi:MAG: DNA alkylation repair protein [Clostridia bacterium]|nr:DNA alkylation repair protein [Clostridia bacterium]
MRYQELLNELQTFADEDYRIFNKKLLKNDAISVLGVRVPQLRKIAKKYIDCVDELLGFPDEYYEVTFVKLTAVSCLKWEEFIKRVDGCVALIDNWATCDCFTPKCIEKHKDEFLEFIYKYLANDGEFYKRFALTTLLHFYVKEKYFNIIEDILKTVETEKYYVHMAAAWLIAELLIKNYDGAVNFLKEEYTDKKTHNKAIQKACESYRLTAEQKTYLKGLKT